MKTVQVKRVVIDGETRAQLFVNNRFITEDECYSQWSFAQAKAALLNYAKGL